MRATDENRPAGATEGQEAPKRAERESRVVRVPRIRTREHEDRIEVALEVPGVTREDVELEVEGRVLTVRARTTGGTAPEGMRALLDELDAGDYEARFRLPRGLATDRVEARLQAGVLELVLPREVPDRRTIPVQAG